MAAQLDPQFIHILFLSNWNLQNREQNESTVIGVDTTKIDGVGSDLDEVQTTENLRCLFHRSHNFRSAFDNFYIDCRK